MTNLPGLSFPANQDFCRHFDLGEHTVSTLNTPMVSKKLQKFLKIFLLQNSGTKIAPLQVSVKM